MVNPIKAIAIFFSVLLVACTGHYEASEFDLDRLNETVPRMFEQVLVEGNVEAQWWPPVVVALNPSEVRMDAKGIYIVLDSFISQESGLFVAAKGFQPNTAEGASASYRLLGENIYSYHFKA